MNEMYVDKLEKRREQRVVDQLRRYRLNARWAIPYFRFVMPAMTTVWGLSLLAEALIRTVQVYNMSVSAFLAISSVTTYGIIGLTIFWTVLSRKHSAKRLQQMIR